MRALLFVLASIAAWPAAALELDLVPVGAAGNADDDTGRGAVPYGYAIGRAEITNTQYAEFLNAVANEEDPALLYSGAMEGVGISFPPAPIGFLRFYEVDPGYENRPVVQVSFWDAVRFANWLHNGQPVGLQGPTTTEDGAYTLTDAGIDDNTVVRNPDALYFVPSEDEWYKAAYYDPALPGYHDYPAGSDQAMACSPPTAVANHANCDLVNGGLTNVGAYPGSPSPFGTFDQGGNVREWVETISGAARQARGGFWASDVSELASTGYTGYPADNELSNVGFRIASVPEPGGGSLGAVAVLTLAALRGRTRLAVRRQ
jgi:formylglycine-generating enzyme required for sulfatase activity